MTDMKHVRIGRGLKVHRAYSRGPTFCGLGKRSGFRTTDAPVNCERCGVDVVKIYGEVKFHETVESFAKATGLSVAMINAHRITAYNDSSSIPTHRLSVR